MPTNKLTDSKCKSAKPGATPQKVSDGGGLFLYITPLGSKLWRCAYRFDGKQQQASFGPYPEVSLAEARAMRDALKAKLREGADPLAGRKHKPDKVTFSSAAESYWAGRGDISAGYREHATRALEMHLMFNLGNVLVGDVTREMLLAQLRVMDAKGLHVYVRKVRMWARQVFDWAIENGHAEINPAALIDPQKAFGRAVVEPMAALEPREVPEFWQRLCFEKDLQSVLACKLLAYAWVRTIELRMMLWSEIEGGVWIVPAGKMKRRKDHVVPLSRQALGVLAEQKARSNGSQYVWPNDRVRDRPMSENAILYLIGRIGYKGRMTGHGFRSIASTWANERGYNPDAIERQLAHAPGDRIRSIYNRSAYLPERAKMLQDWADWLDSCGKVDPGVAQG